MNKLKYENNFSNKIVNNTDFEITDESKFKSNRNIINFMYRNKVQKDFIR